MTVQPFRKDRAVVPRWRPTARVAAAGELAMTNSGVQVRDSAISDELKERLEAWRKDHNIISAAELVETAIVEGRETEAQNAATSLLLGNSGATPLLQKQATLLLKRVGVQPDMVRMSVDIRALRQRVHEFPYDAFSWADLALGFVTIGKTDAAQKAMTVGMQLAPTDRHIIRCAARMHLHLNDPERAHDIIARNEATKHDPWLVAGEIALSSVAGRKPRLLKIGSSMLEDGNFQPFHVSELASAIGTVHLQDGNRRARKFFRTSLVNPTGNSLAQAEWANPHLGGEIVSTQQIERVPDSGEARAFHAYWQGDFESVLRVCDDWIAEEPFSSRPFQVATSVAIMLGHTDQAAALTERGLALDPGSSLLTNHLAYCLIDSGEYARAAAILREALRKGPDELAAGYLAATAGMLAIRIGEVADGIAGYKSAIALFKRHGNRGAEALAASFLALETARAESSLSAEFLKEAEELAKDLRYSPENKIVLSRAKKWQTAVDQRRQQT